MEMNLRPGQVKMTMAMTMTLSSLLFLLCSNLSYVSSTQTKHRNYGQSEWGGTQLFQSNIARPEPSLTMTVSSLSQSQKTAQYSNFSTTHFPSRIRSSGCNCGRKPSVDKWHPVLNLNYRSKKGVDIDMDYTDEDLVSPLIVGGVQAELYEFPWMIAIADISITRQRITCGGVLINSNFILTAAHCVQHKFLVWTEIWFNAHDIDKVKTDQYVLRRKVKRFIIHPKYPQLNREHDIALIELKQPIDFTQTAVRPICLPTSEIDDYAGDYGTVAGWGYNATFSGVRTSTLHKVSVPILSHDACTKTYHFNNVFPTMLCAGELAGGKDACYSDSGGPLIVQHGNRNVVVGIVAWGRGCGRPNLPGVYTRVSNTPCATATATVSTDKKVKSAVAISMQWKAGSQRMLSEMDSSSGEEGGMVSSNK